MQHLRTKCSPEAHSLSSLLALNHSPWRVRHLVLPLSDFGHVLLFATPWTIACQAPLSMGFSKQKYWSGLSCPSPGDLSNPGLEPASLMSCAMAGGFLTTSATWQKGILLPPFSNLSSPIHALCSFSPTPDLLPAFTGASSLYLASSS